jgi:hypothetical protein
MRIRGYFTFAGEVWRLIWRHKWLFGKFILLYALFSVVIAGLMSQENFAAFREALDDSSTDLGIGKWWTLFSNAITGGGGTMDATQQILALLLFAYGWLTLVWLLRRILAGDSGKIKLRDGLYSGGSPVLSTLAVLLIIVVQLLPFALVLLAYVTVTAAGWINTGIQIENMAAWCALAVAAVLTLYWICSSFIALIIVTLPGMYPFRALKAAGDLVVGRRLKLVLRLVFMIIPVVLMWLVILLPAILIDSWLKLSQWWQALVPIMVLILTTLTLIWCVSYIYLLYRKMVDDPTPPPSPRQGKRMARKAARKKAAKKLAEKSVTKKAKKSTLLPRKTPPTKQSKKKPQP